MALELVPLTTLTVKLRSDMVTIPNGPLGTRLIAELEHGELSGERLSGEMAGSAAADWLTVAPDGSYGTLDVRGAFQTTDGAYVYLTYSGKIDLAKQHAVSTPQFQTGDERYEWLNRIQAIGDGRMNDEGLLVYEIHEVRQV